MKDVLHITTIIDLVAFWVDVLDTPAGKGLADFCLVHSATASAGRIPQFHHIRFVARYLDDFPDKLCSMEERIASFASLCKAEPRLIRCPIEVSVVCGRPVPFKEVAEENPVWLNSPDFANVMNLLSTNEGLRRLSINRGLTQGATSGTVIDSAFKAILLNITTLHLSDIDGLPFTFFKCFKQLVSVDLIRVTLHGIPPVSTPRHNLQSFTFYAPPSLRAEDPFVFFDFRTLRSLACGTCNEGDLRCISRIPKQATSALQCLAVDFTSLTCRLTPSLLHGHLAIPSLLFPQLRTVTVTFWVSDFRRRLHGGGMRDPSTSVAALLSSITVFSPLVVELNCIISQGFNHFDWEIIDRAIDDLSKHRTNSNHTIVSLRYKLPATRAPPGIPGYVPPHIEFNLTREKVFPLAMDNASVTVDLFTQQDIAHEGWDEL